MPYSRLEELLQMSFETALANTMGTPFIQSANESFYNFLAAFDWSWKCWYTKRAIYIIMHY